MIDQHPEVADDESQWDAVFAPWPAFPKALNLSRRI